MPARFEVSTRTIIYIFLIVAGTWLVFQIRDILLLLFISFIFMSAMRPGVDTLERRKIPRIIAVLMIYVVVIGVLVLFGTLIVPPLVSETVRLANNLPQYLGTMPDYINANVNSFFAQLAPITQNLAKITIGVFSNIVTVFTVLVLNFYFLLEHKQLHQFLDMFVGKETGDNVARVIHKIEDRMGAWVRGELLLMLIIGLMSYLGLTILGVNYALALAILAGLLEVVPFIGPIISAVPAVLVAFTISPGLAVAVIALYFIIQQFENNLIVPSVMQKAVGIPPLASLLALMIGGKLGGTIGIVLAVPLLLVIQSIVYEFLQTPQKLTK